MGGIADDGLVYTFTMRDAKFEDGSPITARTPPSRSCASATIRLALGDTYKVIKTAEAKDDKTLVVTLNQPTAPFLAHACHAGHFDPLARRQ